MADLDTPFPAVEAVWEAYERRDGDVARSVTDMDLVDMCLQALMYETEARYDVAAECDGEFDALDEFFATAEPRLSTDVGRRPFEQVLTRCEAVRDGAASGGVDHGAVVDPETDRRGAGPDAGGDTDDVVEPDDVDDTDDEPTAL